MNDDASAADRLPLPPMTPHAMRAAHGTAGDLAERSREHAPLLPPFVPGRAPARWRVPFPPQRPHAAVAVPVAEPGAQPVPIAPDPVRDRMPWELDDDAGQDTAAAHNAPFAAPAPFPEPVVPAPQPDPPAQEPAEGFEPWDPSQLWDDPPFGRPAEPTEPAAAGQATEPEGHPPAAGQATEPEGHPPAAVQATAPAGHPSVADRVAARLEDLAAEVRASGINALGAADDADELSRLLAGVVAGFMARDTPNG
jgi:hypothetical protein